MLFLLPLEYFGKLFFGGRFVLYEISLRLKSGEHFVLRIIHFKENKDVAFYADKLCITSKYLTMVIKETSGKSAKDWIVEYIILEIKALLKNTNLNIQEIAIKTNFANQSSLGRFFRKHTGMSLSQYRMSNLEQ